MGLIPAKTGDVIWQGKKIHPQQAAPAGAVWRGVRPAGPRDFPAPDRGGEPLLGLSRFSAREAKQVPDEIWQLFPVLKEMKHRRGGDLSGGQQQQLAIGRAPGEPSAAADSGRTDRRHTAVGDQRDRPGDPHPANRGDMAILLVEQFYDFAAELADSYLLMSRGTIIQRGRCENMEQEGVRGLVAI